MTTTPYSNWTIITSTRTRAILATTASTITTSKNRNSDNNSNNNNRCVGSQKVVRGSTDAAGTTTTATTQRKVAVRARPLPSQTSISLSILQGCGLMAQILPCLSLQSCANCCNTSYCNQIPTSIFHQLSLNHRWHSKSLRNAAMCVDYRILQTRLNAPGESPHVQNAQTAAKEALAWACEQGIWHGIGQYDMQDCKRTVKTWKRCQQTLSSCKPQFWSFIKWRVAALC